MEAPASRPSWQCASDAVHCSPLKCKLVIDCYQGTKRTDDIAVQCDDAFEKPIICVCKAPRCGVVERDIPRPHGND